MGFKEFLFIVGLKKRSIWGPKIPGLSTYSNNLSLEETCDIQLTILSKFIDMAREKMTPDDYLSIKYDDFLDSPEQVRIKLSDFLGVNPSRMKNAMEALPFRID